MLTKEDLELLKLFDHDREYGPCIGTYVVRDKSGGYGSRDLYISQS